ncbi:MAG: VWA domain-containing protein, partial [Bacteroidetes bacterium]|nr:VWA domain-containing protein [Bacteroidota bacterium]
MRRYAAVFVSLFILVTAFAHAQPNLNLKRVVVNWPAVEVYFSVGCNGVPAYNMQATDFRVHDNGEEMGTFTLSCPDPTQPCAMSTTLVFDASGSMAGAGNAGAIAGGMAFVGAMDGQNDEAAVIWFNTSSTLQQGMTSDTSLLNAAVQAIPASGATAVWDALYAGLQETANNGGNSCRAVVVLTDGADNSSTRTPAELIAFAQANHIRVFTIGLGSSFNSIEFQEIAGNTGGRYYQTSSVTQLPMIYQEIAAIIHAGFQECSLVYDATCADGSLHNVEVQLVNFCGGTDTKTKTYLAPIDSSTFSTLPLRLGDVQTSGDADFDMPLLIDTTLAGQSFPQLTIDLCFDSHALGFQGAEIPIGSPLSWMQVLISPTSCGVRIQTQAAGTISGSGELLRLKFHAKVSPPDTAEVGVTASYARLETGCLQPVVSPATVTIAPEIGEPVLSPRCYVPDSLHYDALADAYTPNPFTVRLSCVNIGTDIARDVTARLVLPPGLELANPAEPLTKTVRAGALGPWQIGDAVPEVDWSVRWTKREDHDIDLPIRFIIGGQNNSGDPLAEVSAECSVRIKGLRREFLCTVEWPDTLAMNQAGNDYMPNPVPMRLRLVNSGQLDVRLTRVTFGFSLDGLSLDPSSPQGRDDVLNLTLSPGDHATFDWLVLVQKRSMPRAPRFDWMAYDSTGRSISCSAVMVIPGLPIGALDCELTADTVRADLTAQAYDPMPFTLRLKTRSNKLAVTDSVFARVLLPPGALALAAGDAGLEVKPLSPARIFPQQEAEVEWLLEHPVSTTEQRYTVRTLLWEQGGDTSVCETEVFIPAIPAPFWFTLSASGPTSFCDGGEVTL